MEDIVVDQIDRTDAGAYQRLDGIPADAADPEHRHARPPQLFHGFFAEQKLCS